MNRSTDRAFREISNSIVSACCCSSCGGTCAASGFQAPFPGSCRGAACWLHVGNGRLGRKPEPCKTNPASHLDCARAATEVLAAHCCLSLISLPLTAHGWPPAAAPLDRDTPCKRPVPDCSSLPFWDHLVTHNAVETWKAQGGGNCIISRGTRGGGRNLALEQLQFYTHASRVCLSSSLPPATISACGYPSLQLRHTLQPPALLPSQAAWRPHSCPTRSGQQLDHPLTQPLLRPRGAKSFSPAWAELHLPTPRHSAAHISADLSNSYSCKAPLQQFPSKFLR